MKISLNNSDIKQLIDFGSELYPKLERAPFHLKQINEYDDRNLSNPKWYKSNIDE